MKKQVCIGIVFVMLLSILTLPVCAVNQLDFTVTGGLIENNGFIVENGVATADTPGSSFQWRMNASAAGLARAKVHITEGTRANAIVTVSGVSYTVELVGHASGEFDIGTYDFKMGDTVRIENVTQTGLLRLSLQQPDVYTYDTTAVTFSGSWSKSGAVGYNSAQGYFSSGSGATATWDVPAGLSGAVDVYYYIPNINKTGFADISAEISLVDEPKTVRTWELYSKEQATGWLRLGVVELSGTGREKIKVGRLSEGYTGTARVHGIRFVSTAYESYMITSDHFEVNGSWERDTNEGALEKKNLRYQSVNGKEEAVFEAKVPNGIYYTYFHTCDYPNYAPATRTFKANLNGTDYTKEASGKQRYFGTHGYSPDTALTTNPNHASYKWDWEQAKYPYKSVLVTDGRLVIKLDGSMSSNARVDGILITKNPIYPIDTIEKESARAIYMPIQAAYQDEIPFPADYKQGMTSIQKTAQLSNGNVTISFRQGTLPNGKTVVQRETVTDNLKTNTYESGLGFLSLRADEARQQITNAYYPTFTTTFLNRQNQDYKVSTENIFRAAIPEWVIPSSLEVISEHAVRLVATGDNVDITTVWTLQDNDLEPKVDVSVSVKNAGEYSFGFFNDVNEIDPLDVGYILNPYRWQESRLPENGQLICESHTSTAHTQMTYKIDAQGREVTLGVAVDQSAIVPDRWVRDHAKMVRPDAYGNEWELDYTRQQSNFALGTVGGGGGIQPVVFAPVLCSEDSTFTAGSSYTFSYRPIASVSTEGENRGWYKSYSHVMRDLRGVYDYRDNYYDSMTNTAFNVLNLLKDDVASGWDENLVGHYNIEDTYWVTNSNGLAYLQNYLLTEDKELLMNRTLPMVGTLLTRDSSHLNSQFSYEGRTEGPITRMLIPKKPYAGNSVFEGAYRMSRGQMPVFRNIAKSELVSTYVSNSGYDLQNPSQGLWYDLARGESSLPTLRQLANKYVNTRALVSADNRVGETAFLNVSYYPHFHSTLEAYEYTQEQKYLDGAIEGARRLLPTLQATDMPESKTQMRTTDITLLDLEERLMIASWWWYDTGYRRGATLIDYPETSRNGSVYYKKRTGVRESDALPTITEPYPAWVTSRVGLGLEQFSTCYDKSGNVFMSTFAGDLLRLGYLSDDQLMMDMARASIVGRFENYPGYYITNYNPTVGLKDYPYKGFDSTSIYFHHIPVFLSAIHDYLFANAWVKSDGRVDFPYARSQGYAWFNNRQYGHEPGTIYDETDMWPWLKEGTITLSSKQIDWIAGRKNGRAAFVLTNAGDSDEQVTISFNESLGLAAQSVATVYDKQGNTSNVTVNNNSVTITIPAKGIKTIAVNGQNITIPAFARVEFDATSDGTDVDMGQSAIGLMYEGNTYSESSGYDVKAYTLSMDPSCYMGYIFVGEKSTEPLGGAGDAGILQTTLKWRFVGEEAFRTVVDNSFPYEFFIPVEDAEKQIEFTVETRFKNETKRLSGTQVIGKYPVTVQPEAVNKNNFEPISLSILTAAGSVTPPMTVGKSKYCIAEAQAKTLPFDATTYRNTLKDCYLNGYLVVRDLEQTTDVVESGYVLFDNVKIVESAVNTDAGNRLDFTTNDIVVTNHTLCRQYDANGKYLGAMPGRIHVSFGALDAYDWSNLYITNTQTKRGVYCTCEDNVYTISCDTAQYCTIIKATFDAANRMTAVEYENAIVSVNNSKTVAVEDNQKVFVWSGRLYEGTTMQPLSNVLTK